MTIDTSNTTGIGQHPRNHDSMTLVTFRVKVKELNFFHRMADFYWKSGLIPEPSLRALARACLNTAANKWSGIEEENYNLYIERVIAETEGTYRQLNPFTTKPPYYRETEGRPDSQPVGKPSI
jgi:hypothetical protein